MVLADWLTSPAPLSALGLACITIASILTQATDSSAADRGDTHTILARIRQATGSPAIAAQPQGVLIEGMARYQGLSGPYTLLSDSRGRFVQTIRLARDQVVGFDGTTAWGVDWSGTPRVLELADLETVQTEIWIRTGRWLAEGGPFHIAVREDAGNASQLRLHLKLKRGLRELDLDVDRSTWLPTRLTARRLGTDEVWEFGDYRVHFGITLPSARSTAWVARPTPTKSATCRPASAATLDPFAPRLERPRDTDFRTTGPERFEVKQVTGGHLFVRPKVNGVDVGWFALDTGTGAGMTISPTLAQRLAMPAFGQVVQGGAGKLGLGQLYQGRTFELGSITIHNSVYVELPQAFCDAMKKVFGLDLVGTCGYDLFSRAVVDLDLEKLTASCHEPNAYALASGRWQELRLNRKIPCVQATFEGGRDALFQFDTGAGSHIVFHAPAVAELKLLEHRRTRPIKVGGVGGARRTARRARMVSSRPATAQQFERRLPGPARGCARRSVRGRHVRRGDPQGNEDRLRLSAPPDHVRKVERSRLPGPARSHGSQPRSPSGTNFRSFGPV